MKQNQVPSVDRRKNSTFQQTFTIFLLVKADKYAESQKEPHLDFKGFIVTYLEVLCHQN